MVIEIFNNHIMIISLSAHDDKTQERIADYHKIVKGLSLPKTVQTRRYQNSSKFIIEIYVLKNV